MASKTTSPFGRLNADPDSPDYALACKVRAQGCLNSLVSDIELLKGWFSELRTNDRYRHLDDDHGHPFRDWHHFCTTKQPYGLGKSVVDVALTLVDSMSTEDQQAFLKRLAPR